MVGVRIKSNIRSKVEKESNLTPSKPSMGIRVKLPFLMKMTYCISYSESKQNNTRFHVEITYKFYLLYHLTILSKTFPCRVWGLSFGVRLVGWRVARTHIYFKFTLKVPMMLFLLTIFLLVTSSLHDLNKPE